ncbi:helix-turn-helix transcriptional regulator [Flavobacterium sp. Fl-77]|uniref:Helix-turn-helix transcriptional regulator n=1 Tax=Flavobacterium flavipigmentatum TaxID=2893884 RepID=A0AAJ2SJ54_9FLAO|nr:MULTISPECIES: AraC family transcriptional regulator [unclassified Flavobacterium]MDX6183597.1 helix-turn-helix transcriptional regulator [Flavobacterium sp. Fl-33]MDX6187149.1 helix-turn-helix transcriptional regulator [Flavobacterium sp. Fl-77]UFH38040.1 helix-turn-helix transcriptional regulator [Flavobacterium sp. F-70]
MKSLDSFYQDITQGSAVTPHSLLPNDIQKEIGHFNVFDIKEILERLQGKSIMPYDRRAYYKISLIKGKNRAEYADKIIEIDQYALLFATPKIPYNYLPQDINQSGQFCVFTNEFLSKNKSGIELDALPIFASDGYPVFQLSEKEVIEVELIFNKIKKEINSDYVYKYDLIRNYVAELIHFGQKLQPITALYSKHNSAARVSSLFAELLERQFPIESPHQRLELRTAKDFANRLSVHVNHLNKVLKENSGKTTTELISSRLISEAKILLKQTDWNISEIAYSLGFEELAHFSNFFKKQTSITPLAFRV